MGLRRDDCRGHRSHHRAPHLPQLSKEEEPYQDELDPDSTSPALPSRPLLGKDEENPPQYSRVAFATSLPRGLFYFLYKRLRERRNITFYSRWYEVTGIHKVL